jgi:hypothetical protein
MQISLFLFLSQDRTNLDPFSEELMDCIYFGQLANKFNIHVTYITERSNMVSVE